MNPSAPPLPDESRHHVEDIGKILLQTQNQLRSIRQQLGSEAVRVSPQLQQVIEQAEQDLRSKADVVLQSLVSNQISAIPAQTSSLGPAATIPASMSLTTKLARKQGTSLHRVVSEMHTQHLNQTREHIRQVPMTIGERVRLMQQAELLSRPTTDLCRTLLAKHFRVEQTKPKHQGRAVGRVRSGQRRGFKNTRPLSIPSKQSRIDARAPKPVISDEMLRDRGAMSYIERGFLDPNMDFTDALCEQQPRPFQARPVEVHHFEEQYPLEELRIADPNSPSKTLAVRRRVRPSVAVGNYGFASLSNVHLDLGTAVGQKLPLAHTLPDHRYRSRTIKTKHTLASSASASTLAHTHTPPTTAPPSTADPPLGQPPTTSGAGAVGGSPPGSPQAEAEARTYNELLDAYSLHHFMIRNGKTLNTTPEFHSFARANTHLWGPVTSLLEYLEALCREYAVPLAYVDGKLVSKLASREFHNPTREQLISCLVNAKEVTAIIDQAGRRYQGTMGPDAAATRIQAAYRMHRGRRQYKLILLWRDAAVVIQRKWRAFCEHNRFLIRLQEIRVARQASFDSLQDKLFQDWQEIKTKRRLYIHLPSLSYDPHIRASLPHYTSRQNIQLSRLCDLADPNVDVVYITPFPLDDDIKEYYVKLLHVGNLKHIDRRIRFLTPENAARFPGHFSLASVLYFSLKSMKRLKEYTLGRQAILVPGVVGHYEKFIAAELNVPMLGPEPSLAMTYGSKSGSKRIFQAAQMNTFPAMYDLYNREAMLPALARLCAENPLYNRWLIKLDDEFMGRGHAVIDLTQVMSEGIARVAMSPDEIQRLPLLALMGVNRFHRGSSAASSDDLDAMDRTQARQETESCTPSKSRFTSQMHHSTRATMGSAPSTAGNELGPTDRHTYTTDKTKGATQTWSIHCGPESIMEDDMLNPELMELRQKQLALEAYFLSSLSDLFAFAEDQVAEVVPDLEREQDPESTTGEAAMGPPAPRPPELSSARLHRRNAALAATDTHAQSSVDETGDENGLGVEGKQFQPSTHTHTPPPPPSPEFSPRGTHTPHTHIHTTLGSESDPHLIDPTSPTPPRIPEGGLLRGSEGSLGTPREWSKREDKGRDGEEGEREVKERGGSGDKEEQSVSGSVPVSGGQETRPQPLSSLGGQEGQEPSYRIHLASPEVYGDWATFLEALESVGGVLEACPDIEDILGSPAVDMLIEPDGNLIVLAMSEQIFLSEFRPIGALCPQSAVPAPALRDAAIAIGEVCYSKSIIGWVSVDFVAYRAPQGALKLAAVDLNIGMSSRLASFRLTDFVLKGTFDAQQGEYLLLNDSPGSPDRCPSRAWASLDLVFHPNIATTVHSAFIMECRDRAISFDLQERSGTIFHLVDSFQRGALSMSTVALTASQAVRMLHDNLEFISVELGTTEFISGEEQESFQFEQTRRGVQRLLQLLEAPL